MNGLLFTITFFPLVGLAISSLAGRLSSYLAGTGAAGMILFAGAVWKVPLGATLIVLAAASILIVILRWRTIPPRLDLGATPERSRVADALIAIAALILLIVAAIVPLKDYDGRAFWLLKAKAIAHEGAIDGPFFRGETSSNPRNEYPLLVPLDAAAILIAAGDLDDRHVRWLFALFPVALAVEIRRRLGSWYGAAFLWLPQIMTETDGGALSGYADIALAAFVACAYFEIVERGSPLRVGLWTAFAILTKNEGLPLAGLLLMILPFVFRRRALVAFVPPLIVVAHLFMWRARIEPSDEDQFARMIFDLPQNLGRFGQILLRLGSDVFDVHDWGVVFGLAVAAALVLVARRQWRQLTPAAAIIVPMFALYAAVMAVTSWDLEIIEGGRLLTHLVGPMLHLVAAAFSTASGPRRAAL